MRQRAIAGAFRTIAAVRADRWLAPIARGVGLVMTLHRVQPFEAKRFSPNRALSITPAFLRKLIAETRNAGFEFATIDDATASLRAPRAGVRPFAVLTFDDGYRDNITFAAPILKAEGIPWTLFVVPDFLSGKGHLWWIELEAILARLDELRIGTSPNRRVVATRTTIAKARAFDQLRRRCHLLDERMRHDMLNMLRAQAGQDCRVAVSGHCLTWKELQAALLTNDITVGSHTSSHAILPTCDDEDAAAQITGSRLCLEAKLERPILHLAYPHGRTFARGDRDARLAFAAGYTAAWTTMPGHLRRVASRAPFALPRVTVNGMHQNEDMLRSVLSGVPFLLGGFFCR